jgi:hypothetical protein
MKILFGLAAGVALTLAIRAESTPIAISLSALALGSVSTIFAQAELRHSRRRVVKVGTQEVEIAPQRLVVLQGGKKVASFRDPMASSPWTSK